MQIYILTKVECLGKPILYSFCKFVEDLAIHVKENYLLQDVILKGNELYCVHFVCNTAKFCKANSKTACTTLRAVSTCHCQEAPVSDACFRRKNGLGCLLTLSINPWSHIDLFKVCLWLVASLLSL